MRAKLYGLLTLCLALVLVGCSDPSGVQGGDNPYEPSRTPTVNPSKDPSVEPSADPSKDVDPSSDAADESYSQIISNFERELQKITDIVEMYDRDVPVSALVEEDEDYIICFGSDTYSLFCDFNARGVPDFGVTRKEGKYLWTVDGNVLSEDANVLTGKPSLRVAGGKWQVKYGSSSWQTLEDAVKPAEVGSIVLFSDVEQSNGYVLITFADGSFVSLAMEEDEYDYSYDPVSDDPSSGPVTLSVGVTTGSVSSITSTSATISGSFYNASQPPTGSGFEWGLSSGALSRDAYVDKTFSGASGSFNATLTSLEEGTTYYYRAYVILNNEKYFYGSVKSFTTATSGTVTEGRHYLGCYEMPAMDLNGKVSTGNELHGSTKYYSYETNSSGKQLVVTHTYKEAGHQVRNYTVLFDGDKHCPIWTAFVMQKDEYPDNNVGRSGSWKDDPAVPSSWQQGGVSGYSRGHHVASNYRQSSSDGSAGNKQTFYHTNQSPQYQNGFNDGVWNKMELAIKGKAPYGRDTLYVTVGTLFEDGKTISGVSIPSHFYCCVMYCGFDSSGNMTSAKGEAYLYTNESHGKKEYTDFRTSIDAIEQRSGFNFFASVPENLQSAAEKTTSGVL